MADIKLSGRDYRIGKLTPLKQLFVGKRLLPIVPGMAQIMDLASLDTLEVKDLITKLHELQPFIDSMARLPDTDVEFIVNTCLSVVARQEGMGYAPVMVGNVQALQDIDLPDIMQLVFAVLQENLLSFFPEQPPTSEIAPLRAVRR